MATQTINYNLINPEGTDQVQQFLAWFANNMGIIDQYLGQGSGGVSDVQVDGTSVVTNGVANILLQSVSNLANYYLKSETYTQAEVDALISVLSIISYTQTLASGTKVGEITIDGVSTDINAPIYKIRKAEIPIGNPYLEVYSDESGESTKVYTSAFASKVSWNSNSLLTGDHVGDIIIDGLGTTIYSKSYTSGDGINITTDGNGQGVVNLEYLTVVDGAVNITFDDGN